MAMNLDAVLRITAKVDGGNALQKLGADLAGIGKQAGSTLSPFGQMRGALRGLADVTATIGLAAIGRDLLQAGVEAEISAVRINALAKGYGEVQAVSSVASQAAKEFALGNVEAQNAVMNLYGRLRPMNISLKDIETVFFGVNKAAKLVGLSTHDTSEVLLQLSQALGSGVLQGDELRSIMERMPAVGQAVAKAMGVSASEIKKLGSEGKITTEVMIRAAAELNKIVPPPPTSMQEFDKALKDLRTELGENLLPLLTPFVQALTGLIKAFAGLPEPIQTATIALAALVIAAGPVASVITGLGNALFLLGSLGIGATIAGWAGAVIPAVVAIKGALIGLVAWIGGTLIPSILAFMGPVGWVVLAIAAVVAMAIAFREPLWQFAQWLWQWTEFARAPFVRLWDAVVKIVSTSLGLAGKAIQAWATEVQKIWSGNFSAFTDIANAWWQALQGVWQGVAQFFRTYVTDPIGRAWQAIGDFIPKSMEAAAGIVRSVFGRVLAFIVGRVNTVSRMINTLIDRFNQLSRLVNGPEVGRLPIFPVPAFAEGGTVSRPTLAMVGEGGEREYIIPESKMQAASSRFLGGARGAAVIPSTSNSGTSSGPIRTPQVNVTTGPVMQQQDGSRWVSMDDYERGLQQVTEQVIGMLRTPQAKTALGWR